MYFTTILTIFGFSIFCLAAPNKRATNPTVTISAGTIVGTATRVSNQPSVTNLANAYLGVPYAQKPVRFAPPVRAGPLSSPFQAKTLPPVCLEQYGTSATGQKTKAYFDNPINNPFPAQSEDCLYLNIFTPQSASSSNRKAVLFWLFGGNLAVGGAGLVAYNGSSLAVNQDVVVVAINYRTNIFGFSSSPEIDFGKQNVGFLDQRLALQWVQENIAQFGGDPTKVTLFGQSAGGFSIKQLLANPPDPLPFHAAILESEGASGGNGSTSYQSVVSHFGCASASSPIQCLRGQSATAIQDYIQQNSNLTFPPVIGDGTNLQANTKSSIDNGSFAPVPILIGNNNDEVTIFLDIAGITPDANLNLNDTLQAILGVDVSSITYELSLLYSATVGNTTFSILNRFLTDLVYTCPNQILSEYIAGKQRQPVWRYRYDPGFPNLEYKPYFGSYHSSEITTVWGTYPITNQYGTVTQNQTLLSSYMQSVWANFAKNPSGGPGWPKVGSTSNGQELGIIGGANQTTGEYTALKIVADYPCPLLDVFILAIGGGY